MRDFRILRWTHMLDEAFGLDESYAEFSGIDFSRSFPRTAEEDVSAKRLFHATKTPFSYGYILPDGTLLDFGRRFMNDARNAF